MGRRSTTVQTVINKGVQKPGPVIILNCRSVFGPGHSHFCDVSISAERHTEILNQHMLPLRGHLFQGIRSIRQCQNTFYPHYKGMAERKEAKKGIKPAG